MLEIRKLINCMNLLESNDMSANGGNNFLNSIDMASVELAGVETYDYPDFVDAYVDSAYYKNGRPLSNNDIDKLNDMDDVVQQLAHDSFF